jgi:hypothetical protein
MPLSCCPITTRLPSISCSQWLAVFAICSPASLIALAILLVCSSKTLGSTVAASVALAQVANVPARGARIARRGRRAGACCATLAPGRGRGWAAPGAGIVERCTSSDRAIDSPVCGDLMPYRALTFAQVTHTQDRLGLCSSRRYVSVSGNLSKIITVSGTLRQPWMTTSWRPWPPTTSG